MTHSQVEIRKVEITGVNANIGVTLIRGGYNPDNRRANNQGIERYSSGEGNRENANTTDQSRLSHITMFNEDIDFARVIRTTKLLTRLTWRLLLILKWKKILTRYLLIAGVTLL